MTSGVSLGQLQWIYWLQETEYKHVQLQHAFFQGEIEFNKFYPDGYALINGEHHFFEYLGKTINYRV